MFCISYTFWDAFACVCIVTGGPRDLLILHLLYAACSRDWDCWKWIFTMLTTFGIFTILAIFRVLTVLTIFRLTIFRILTVFTIVRVLTISIALNWHSMFPKWCKYRAIQAIGYIYNHRKGKESKHNLKQGKQRKSKEHQREKAVW